MSKALFASWPRSKHGSSTVYIHIPTRPSASPQWEEGKFYVTFPFRGFTSFVCGGHNEVLSVAVVKMDRDPGSWTSEVYHTRWKCGPLLADRSQASDLCMGIVHE